MDRVNTVSIDTATAIIRNCMTLMRVGDFKESVIQVVRDIIDTSEARNASIMLIDDENRKAVKYVECLAPSFDVSKMPGDGNIPYEVVKGWQMMIGNNDSIIIRNKQERDESAKHSPALARMIECNKMETVCMLPLRREQEVFGFMYVVNFNAEKADETKNLLEIMAFFIATEIFNNQLMVRLRRMSVQDELTGLFNRNAMINRMNKISDAKEQKPIGIINMDLNGLKQINDTQGHSAGDNYLIYAAKIMKSIFGEADVYRSGGDEFIAIIENRSHEEFAGLIEAMRNVERTDSDISLAIGSYWSEDGLGDIRTAFMNADQSMYIDKKRYYKLHPEYDRRGH